MGNAGRQGPAIGSWVADPTKPIAIVDKSGKHMIFYPPQRPQRPTTQASLVSSHNSSPSRPVSSHYESESDRGGDPGSSMLVPSPANLMMSGLFGNNSNVERVFGAPVVGPPEAFYPWRIVDAQGNYVGDDEDYDEDDEDDAEDNLNIHDFIDFGDVTASDPEENEDEPSSNASATEMA